MTQLVVVALGFASAAGVLALDRLANRVVRPVPRPPSRTVPDSGLEHEDITIVSGEHRLRGWLLRGRAATLGGQPPGSAVTVETSGAPLFLLAHGWGASHGTALQLAEPLAGIGYDSLLFDMRGHGYNHAVPYVTVRHLRDDVAAAIRYARERFGDRPLVLVGHSFGGAASVLAVAEGADVDGLALIATPADVVQITGEYLSAKGMPGALMTTVLRPFWWWRLGGTFAPHSPARRISELEIPLVVIQPEHDQRVHRRHADRLAAAAGVSVHLVAGHEHTDVLGAPETLRLVTGLLERLGAGSR